MTIGDVFILVFGIVAVYCYKVDCLDTICTIQCRVFCDQQLSENVCTACKEAEHGDGEGQCLNEECTHTDCYVNQNWPSTLTAITENHLPSINVTVSLVTPHWFHLTWPPSPLQSETILLTLIHYRSAPLLGQFSDNWESAFTNGTSYELDVSSHGIAPHGMSSQGVTQCQKYEVRAAAVSPFGSQGFSPISDFTATPGPTTGLMYTGRHTFNPHDEEITVAAQIGAPEGWDNTDISEYQVRRHPNHPWTRIGVLQSNCPAIQFDIHSKKNLRLTVHQNGFNCNYNLQIMAVSSCGVKGAWSDVTVILNDCDEIVNFPCPETPLNVPGAVGQVQITKVHGADILHVHWSTPEDLGSEGVIDRYIIEWGNCISKFPLHTLSNVVNATVVDAITHRRSYGITITYNSSLIEWPGVRILAVSPSQTDLSSGMLKVYCVSPETGHGPSDTLFSDGEKFRLDDLPIWRLLRLIWNMDLIQEENEGQLIEKYAVAWGPVDVGKLTQVRVESQKILKAMLSELLEKRKRNRVVSVLDDV